MNQPAEYFNNEWELWFLPYRGVATRFTGDEVLHPDLLGKMPATLSETVSLVLFPSRFLSFG